VLATRPPPHRRALRPSSTGSLIVKRCGLADAQGVRRAPAQRGRVVRRAVCQAPTRANTWAAPTRRRQAGTRRLLPHVRAGSRPNRHASPTGSSIALERALSPGRPVSTAQRALPISLMPLPGGQPEGRGRRPGARYLVIHRTAT
jgi:hypothetical protein